MNKMKIWLLFALSCILFINCHGDYMELGNDYIYSEHTIAKLSGTGQYRYSDIIVMDYVVNFNYDNCYIVAYQRPSRRWIEFRKDYLDKEELDSIETLYTKICRINHCYWIIRKNDGIVLGPLDKCKYDSLCKKLSVNIQMDSKFESDYRSY